MLQLSCNVIFHMTVACMFTYQYYTNVFTIVLKRMVINQICVKFSPISINLCKQIFIFLEKETVCKFKYFFVELLL